MKVKILVDSTADIPFSWMEKYDIDSIPLYVVWEDGKSEPDERKPEEIMNFYKRIRETSNVPKTSQPSVEDFKKRYLKYKEEGYDAVLVFTISSKLSGTYNSAVLASREVDIPVYVVDTLLASGAIPLPARVAREMLENGATIEEVLKKLDERMKNKDFKAIFYVSDFDYLVKGGRVSKFQGFVGNLLKIRVCLHIENGELIPYRKVRGDKKAIEALIEKLREDTPEGSKLRVIGVHADNETGVVELLNTLRKSYEVVDEIISPMGKVITTHVGPGTVGFGIEVLE